MKFFLNTNFCSDRPVTNVYWVHMPRNVSRLQPEEGNPSNSLASPEDYPTNEPSNASSCLPSKSFHIFSDILEKTYAYC